jgi:predicted lipoprotein with Yx(FWY)xxD motif
VVTQREKSPSASRATILVTLVFALVACGGNDDDGGVATEPSAAPMTAPSAAETAETQADDSESEPPAAEASRRPAGEDGLRVAASRAEIVVQESDFGRILFDANGQVVYAFELDRKDESNCTSADCVRAWPPVLTEQAPSAGAGVDAELLGTIERDDGSLQVTYAGRPLYFYEHEAPGEIKCHNVNLHGGLWWVVAPSGDPVA